MHAFSKHRLWPGWTAVLVLLSAAATAQASPTLRVRAKVQIELYVAAFADGLHVQGTLHDDLAAALAGRELALRVSALRGSVSRAQLRTLRSDGAGKFALVLPLAEGAPQELRVQVAFEGDTFYERAEAEQLLEPERRELRLQFLAPTDQRISLDQPNCELIVEAWSALGGAGLRIELQDELGRPLAADTTGSDGRVTLVVQSARLGEPGVGELVAIAAGDRERSGARVVKPVLRSRATQIALRAELDAPLRRVRVQAELTTRAGALPQRAIGLFLDGAHLATILTDQQGVASRAFERDSPAVSEGAHELTGRFESDAAGLTSSQSQHARYTIAAHTPPSQAWLILSALASLALGLWAMRRRNSLDDPRPRTPSAPAAVQFGSTTRGRANLFELEGTVRDADNALPLTASLELRLGSAPAGSLWTDSAGRFASAALAPGNYQVTARSSGYAPAGFELRVPHAGAGSGISVALKSLRALALDAYAPIARRVLSSEAGLQVATVRDTLSAAVSGAQAGPALTQLSELVERIAYARTTPDERDLAELQRAAAAAIADLDARTVRVNDPSLE